MPSEASLERIADNLELNEAALNNDELESESSEVGSEQDTESVLAELSDELESLTAELSEAVSTETADSVETSSSTVDIFDYKVSEVAVQQASRQQDAARISTNNLETLLNQAGEVSIYRSRIEQEISNAALNLNELARTVPVSYTHLTLPTTPYV